MHTSNSAQEKKSAARTKRTHACFGALHKRTISSNSCRSGALNEAAIDGGPRCHRWRADENQLVARNIFCMMAPESETPFIWTVERVHGMLGTHLSSRYARGASTDATMNS